MNCMKREFTSTPAQAVNALWFRLDQARAVALCISDKYDVLGGDGAVAALAQVIALAGAVSELLTLALNDTQALEVLVAVSRPTEGPRAYECCPSSVSPD